jgi:CRP-like cAMP-binding protein
MQPPPAALIALLRPYAQQVGLWQPRRYARGDRVEHRLDEAPRLVIVTAGIVKLSYLSAEGDERVKSFIVAEGLFGQDSEEGGLTIEARCLEDSGIVFLAPAWVRDLAARSLDVQQAIDAFWPWLSSRKRIRENALLCLTPEQRYRAFTADEPMLAQRLSQGDIARYLGVTPVAFSRMKRRLRTSRGERME